jgi:hypothetical protein
MFLLTCLILCIVSPFASGEERTHKSTIPEYLSAWLKVPPPSYDSSAWYAANYSEYEWQVGRKNGRPVAYRRDLKAEAADALPAVLRRADGKPDERGRVHAVKVSDGWLVGYNAGEWGGSLWWYAAEGQQRYKISDDQIVQFLPTTQGLYALEGVAHMSISRGKVVQLQQNAQGRWISVRFVDLGKSPEVGLVEGDGSLLISTTANLVLIHPDKTRTVLLPTVFWQGLYPGSIALGPNGDIYLGMRHGVSRIHQVNHKYVADWLLPNTEFVHVKAKM